MSQLEQQNDGSLDFHLHFSSPDHPPAKDRDQLPYASANPSGSRKRSLRKAVPSPLQTSTTAISPPSSVTPTRSTFLAAGALSSSPPDTSPQSPREEPRSPKERLDDLLASEHSFYQADDSVSESLPATRFPQYPNAPVRSVSDSVLISKPLGGSQTSSTMAATAAPQHRVDMGRVTPPRTSSIDSAISSLSASTHSHKSSQETNPSTGSPEIAHLIQAAGSPEAVIQYLVKEKQSQAAQNSQLWRLVDKQRAMILGLNKDLERALKDKERYRKKLKEHLAQISNPSPVDSNHGVAYDAGSVPSDPIVEAPRLLIREPISPTLTKVPVLEHDDRLHSPIDVALAPYPITPPANQFQTPALANMTEAEHIMPSPTKHAFQQYNPDAVESAQQPRQVVEVSRELPYNASVPPSRSLPSDPPRGPPPKAPQPKSPVSMMPPPSVSVIEASPLMDDGIRAFPSVPRKAPPAPLDLRMKNQSSAHLRQASGTGEDSDSDYDDILEVDEIPNFPERGRRKTREDDDKEREVAAMKEAELRSLSKKSGKNTPKSRPTTPKDGAFKTEESFPPNPRQIAPASPPPQEASSRHMTPIELNAGSLAGILSASSNGTSKTSSISAPLMSPGLPLSPRPMDRITSPFMNSFNSPPMSPRGMLAFASAVPLSPRAPRQPIPLPPNTPMSIASPGLPRGEPITLVTPLPLVIAKKSSEAANTPSPQDESPRSNQSPVDHNQIYKGLVTEEYPDLLLPPNALPSIDVRVSSSRLKPSRSSLMFPKNFEEDPVFTLAVFARSDGRELWRVEKDSASLAALDQLLKQCPSITAKTPDKSLFSGHAPAKIDARRAALDKYLNEVLNTQMDMESALHICRYLSTNTIKPHAEDLAPSRDSASVSPIKRGPGGRPLKNGYLTKRGKNFGGWKARFFVLDGPIFKYYESPGGALLGAIKLQKAQIGKQQQQSDNHSPSRGDGDDPDNQYRHAFLILEPKRKDSASLVRHVLCAESDLERDEWVDALLRYVDYKDSEEDLQGQHQKQEHPRINGGNAKKKAHAVGRGQVLAESNDDLRGVSYETTAQGAIPHGVRQKNSGTNSGTPSPPTYGHERDPMSQLPQSQPMKSISAPKNAQVIQDVGSWGNKQNMLAPTTGDDKLKAKKRSFFGFGSKPRASIESQEAVGANDSNTNLSQMAYEQHGPIRPVFGSPLGEAVKYNHPVDVNIELPAVVYRCIEYLDIKNAAGEEGIFRLSGSNVVIKQLRERFNVEGDVNLITDGQYYDIHAVASLLKLYLRELPSTILTRDLHLEFIAVTELHDLNEKIRTLNNLVHRLPRANNALLRYLSGFLINIISHSDTNKMTIRNVGIVFSPTLNIPAPVFALFLQQYEGIFEMDPQPQSATTEVTVTAPPLTPEDIRSPRRQKFQELPTPSYDQQSFPHAQPPPTFPIPQYYQQQQQLQSPQQQQRSGYDTGFTPLQPAYESQQLQQQQRGSYDTGFTPLQPAYESQMQGVRATIGGSEYSGRASPIVGPAAYDQYNGGSPMYRQYSADSNQQSAKSKRRESSMFGMGVVGGIAQKKPSSSKLRDDSRLVGGESFFE